jgi:hypothetical protein
MKEECKKQKKINIMILNQTYEFVESVGRYCSVHLWAEKFIS